MANSKQATKRARQSERKRVFAQANRSLYRTAIKKFLIALQDAEAKKDASLCKEDFLAMQSILDRMSRKGIISSAKAARHKHRFNARVKQIAAK